MEESRPAPPNSQVLRQQSWSQYIERASRGDESALASLYDESKSLVYGLALRVVGEPADAEEVTLDVFTQVWRTASAFDGSRGNAVSWLVLMTRSRAIDRVRSRTARSRLEEPMEDVPEPSCPAEGLNHERQTVRHAMRVLTDAQRRLIEMAFFSGFTHSELAQALAVPLGTIKTRIRVAMLKLKEELTKPTAGSMRSSHGA